MATTDITQTTYTDLSGKIVDYSVSPKATDGITEAEETYYDNSKFNQWFAYYKGIPEYKTAINAFATWVIGQGWDTDARTQVILEAIDGWGEDTFLSILWNMLVIKKVNGDAFAEIIRDDDGRLLNIKPLDPASVRIVANRKGRVIRYEQRTKTSKGADITKFKPFEILHLCNDRIADEIHGTSVTEGVEWVILTRNEAMADQRRILHRSTIRVMEVDEDDKTRLTNLKKDYAEAINKGELLLVPKGTGDIKDFSAPQTQHLEWIRYLENFFYQALGIPKVIMGGTSENTEASAKISTIVFEPIFVREIKELEADLWNQLGIRLQFNKQPSLMDNMQTDEMKNTGQIGFQANDVTAGSGKA